MSHRRFLPLAFLIASASALEAQAPSPAFRLTAPEYFKAGGADVMRMMADRYPNDPLDYHARFLQQWSYIDGNLIDHEHGGWYQGGLDKEPQQRAGLKGHIGKAAYHDGRALMNVIRALEGGS